MRTGRPPRLPGQPTGDRVRCSGEGVAIAARDHLNPAAPAVALEVDRPSASQISDGWSGPNGETSRMNTKARPCTLGMSLTLGVTVIVSLRGRAGSGARAQELEWATSAGGEAPTEAADIATDPRGNSYVTGNFQARRRSGRAKPTRPCSAMRAAETCSWRSTPATALSCGPRARAARIRRRASASRRTRAATAT